MPCNPFRAFGAEVVWDNPWIQKLDNRGIFHTTGGLVLVYWCTLAEGIVHELVKCSTLNYPYFQRPNRFIRGSALAVHTVEWFFHDKTAVLKNRRWNRGCTTEANLPVQYIVARDGWRVCIACVFCDRCIKLKKMVSSILHSILQLKFIGFIRINAKSHIFSADKFELGRLVLESSYTKYISNPISIETCNIF